MTREIITIKVNVKKADPLSVSSDVLAVGVFSDKNRGSICTALDKKLKGAIGNLFKLGDFRGKAGSVSVLYSEGRINSSRIILAGLGEKKKVDAETLRMAVIKSVCRAVELKAKKISLAIHQDLIGSKGFDAKAAGRILAEASHFGGYRYDEFLEKKKPSEQRPKSISVNIVDSSSANISKMKRAVAEGNVTGSSQNYARTIMNRPANVLYPESLAKEAKKLAASTKGLSCMVWDYGQIKAKRLGGLLAVGQGAEHKPRFIVLKYIPAGAAAKTPAIGLVGKAVTFDSGGISIKPGAGMHDMKFDKSGGIAVLGAMKIISMLKPKVKVYGIIPSAENMPGANSYRPGDIITTYSGKTVEIQNTDAEGRMILSDGIHYAVKQKCRVIVDVATLTGACVVALGEGKAGLFSNDDKLVKQLQEASDKTCESIWHMPAGPEYLEQMNSKIADLKNIGGKWGGACTAAAFLSAFAGDAKWAHLDIAGVGMVDGQQKYGIPGSIGYGARLLAEFVCSYK